MNSEEIGMRHADQLIREAKQEPTDCRTTYDTLVDLLSALWLHPEAELRVLRYFARECKEHALLS